MEEKSLERMMENSPPGGKNEFLMASTGQG